MTDRFKSSLFVWLTLGPALLVVVAVVAYPFFYNIVVSLSNANLYTIRDWRIIGFAQYGAVLAEPLFWSTLGKTVVWTVANLTFHTAIGLFLAIVLHQKFIRGKAAWRVLLILPWAMPQYITALTWRGMFNFEYGAVNLLLTKYLHLPAVQWLQSPFEAFSAAILTNIWLGFPFIMVVALGGLQSIPDELYEAAEVDGAGPWRKFVHVTLPQIWPILVPALTLSAVWTFNNINVIWLLTNGGEPADSSHILVSYVYKAAFALYRFGWAAALSIIIFVILFLAVQILLRRAKTEPA